MPILQVVLLLMVAVVAEALSPVVRDHDRRMPANRRVLLECMSGRASPDKNISCVSAYRYVQEFCDVTHEPLYSRRYRSIKKLTQRFEEACDLAGFVDGKAEMFFEIDVGSCVASRANPQERLLMLEQNKELFTEGYEYLYKKNSCKEYRGYVNLCEFVDGSLKTAELQRTEFLPSLKFSRATEPTGSAVCTPQNAKAAGGIYRMTQDLVELSQDPQDNIYKALITRYRAQRGPANTRNAVCQQVRNSYGNLGCAEFEKFLDGEPIYFNADDFRQIRIEQNKELRNGGRAGGQN